MLALYYLQPIRESGSLQPGATTATTIADMLRVVFDTSVFGGLLYDASIGVVAEIEDHSSYGGTTNHMLSVVGYFRDNVQLERLASPQDTRPSGTSRIPQLPDNLLQLESSPQFRCAERIVRLQ